MTDHHWLGTLPLLALLAVGCDKKEAEASAVASSQPVASAAPSAAPPEAPPTSKLRVLAKAEEPLFGTGSNGDGVVVAKGTGLVIADGKLSELTNAARGLERTKWIDREVIGDSSPLAVIAGTRDPDAIQTADLGFGDDRDIDETRTVFRWLRKNGWSQVAAVRHGEELGGIGRYQGRIVAAIQMAGQRDYRFALIAGKPGIALPAPTPAEKPKEPEEQVEPAPVPQPPTGAEAGAVSAGGAGGVPPASAGAAGSPGVAASAKPEAEAAPKPTPTKEEAAPKDPSKPHPDMEAGCETRLLPAAFDGLPSGEAMLLGSVCPGEGDHWIEHWLPKKRKASFEKIPQPPGPNLELVMTDEGRAVVVETQNHWAIERDSSGKWKELALPGSGEVQQVAVAPAGRLWMIIGGRVYSRAPGAGFVELLLPEGVRPLRVFPADGEEPFVLTRNELLGPVSAVAGDEVATIGPAATSLCTEPYVIVEAGVRRSKKYPKAVEKVQASGVKVESLVFGHRGITGKDFIQAKMADMKSAQALSKALQGAKIYCGAPRTEAKVPDFEP